MYAVTTVINFQSFLLCCHHATVHITSAVVPSAYIEGLHFDTLQMDDYLIVKRSRKYDLSIPTERKQATREILGLLRYLTQMVRAS